MKKLIIADKADSEFRTISDRLRNGGFEVIETSTAEEAIRAHENNRVKMIIADLEIETMGGDGLANTLKDNNELRKGVYIILVCNGRKAEIERCGRSGANTFIKRPVDIDALLPRIEAIMNNQLARATRVLVKVDVSSLYHNESFFSTSKNLSATGMLLESDKTLAKSDEIKLSFFLPDEDRINSTGKIVRVARGEESKYVYGVEFVHMEDDHKNIIDSFIDRQRKEGNFY